MMNKKELSRDDSKHMQIVLNCLLINGNIYIDLGQDRAKDRCESFGGFLGNN